jgi:hypothetical protein
MGLLGWLDRIAGRVNRKISGTAVVVAAENAPTTATPAAAAVIATEEAEEVRAEGS